MANVLLVELEHHLKGRVDARRVLRILQTLSNSDISKNDYSFEPILNELWNHDLLLDDCILVSGIIFVRSELSKQCSVEEILERNFSAHKHADWVRLGILRGLLVVCKASLHPYLQRFWTITASDINAAVQANRLILIARHLENLIQILELEYSCGAAPSHFSFPISDILGKTLLLKSDLVEYKSRDLIKYHYRNLEPLDAEAFLLSVLKMLPEVGKVALQCFDAALEGEMGISTSLAKVIFEHALPLIKVKGLGQTAAKCVAKIIQSSPTADYLLGELFNELSLLPGTKEKISFTKMLFSELDSAVRNSFKGRIKSFSTDQALSDLLLMLIESSASDIVILPRMLKDADEYYCYEAFSILVRDSQSSRRKPIESFSVQDLNLFKVFIQDVSFSGSIELRQKVLAASKSFYEQIFGRIYHLIRDSHKNRSADQASIAHEIGSLLGYLNDLFLTVFIGPFDFVKSNCGSLEFVFKQILLVIGSFEGNVTLAGANSTFMNEAQSLFQGRVIAATFLRFTSNFLSCVGHNTYDNLRLLCSEILFKCRIPVDRIEISPYYNLLGHPRAINNEGAARMIQLYSRLQSSSLIFSQLKQQIEEMFAALKTNFPASLMHNNVNGRMLALRLLLSDTGLVDQTTIKSLIDCTIEISSFVSGVASHPSPEGLDLNEQVDVIDHDEFETQLEDLGPLNTLPSSQYVLSFAWRAIKESSLLLEAIVETHSSLIDASSLDCITKHFIHLLLSLRHRGAFSSVEGPLTSVLKRGFTFPQIKCILVDILQVALKTEEISSTRRSAGLPHLILAIAHSCTKSSEIDELLALLIPELTGLAGKDDTLDTESPALIHAFNITRSLVRDSKLAPELSRHLGQVALMCLNTFNSSNWSVRNASSMLLSSLISRVFGSAHLNQSAADPIDLREMEVKFYGLLEVIESFMTIAMTKSLIEARLAYPLLAVLERIRIPANERFDSFRLLVQAFLAKLVRDLSCNQENGRKLIFVISRVFKALLKNSSLTLDHDLFSSNIDWTQANSVFNHFILLDTLAADGFIDPETLDGLIELALNSCQTGWNPSILRLIEQASSHNSVKSVEKEASHHPVTLAKSNASEYLTAVLESCTFVAYQEIEDCLRTLEASQVSADILFGILTKFKLNEAIIEPTLRLLCQVQGESIDDRLADALKYYSSFLTNENVRFICVAALKCLTPALLVQIPSVMFDLLLDDSNEIRLEACTLIASLTKSPRSLNLLSSLRAFVDLVGNDIFRSYLESQPSNAATSASGSLVLFEQEPLNAFIDTKWLLFHFRNE